MSTAVEGSVPSLGARDLRQAIDAALRGATFDLAEARLDDLAARARKSAALPELRLRATRLADSAASLSPTSYDALRTTASTGASVWLEARAVWSLDRAVFASEELRMERIRREIEGERARLERRVVELLFAWQAAALAESDPSASETECRMSWLRRAQLATELDLITGGWVSRRHPNSVIERPLACTSP